MTMRITSYRKLIFSIVLLPSLLLGGCFSSCGETAQIQKNMTDGLKKIYGKEFVVGRPHMTGNPGFGYHYEAKAYPKDNPEIKFTVAYDMNQDGKYGEDYLEQLWMYQGKHDLEIILKKLYGDNFLIYSYSFEYYNREFKNMNYAEVLKSCDGWVNLWIEYYVFTDKKIDKQVEAKIIYNLLDNLMLKNHLRKYRLIVGYSPTSYKSNRYFEINYEKSGKSVETLRQEGILSNYFDLMYLPKNGPEPKKLEISDIVSLFK